MKPTHEVVACVVDCGLFIHIARRLARDYAKVYYWSPWEFAFPCLRDSVIGDGYPDIIAAESVESVKDECDLFVFPDIGYADLRRPHQASPFPRKLFPDCSEKYPYQGSF